MRDNARTTGLLVALAVAALLASRNRPDRPLMRVVYLLVLGALALFTAHTRNFQRTIVALSSHLDAGADAHLVSGA